MGDNEMSKKFARPSDYETRLLPYILSD